jgi:hypothetical protein
MVDISIPNINIESINQLENTKNILKHDIEHYEKMCRILYFSMATIITFVFALIIIFQPWSTIIMCLLVVGILILFPIINRLMFRYYKHKSDKRFKELTDKLGSVLFPQ